MWKVRGFYAKIHPLTLYPSNPSRRQLLPLPLPLPLSRRRRRRLCLPRRLAPPPPPRAATTTPAAVAGPSNPSASSSATTGAVSERLPSRRRLRLHLRRRRLHPHRRRVHLHRRHLRLPLVPSPSPSSRAALSASATTVNVASVRSLSVGAQAEFLHRARGCHLHQIGGGSGKRVPLQQGDLLAAQTSSRYGSGCVFKATALKLLLPLVFLLGLHRPGHGSEEHDAVVISTALGFS
nr:uncharacterized protein LOC107281606 isoform X2 [Oryza sativa Japonica Group]